MPYIFICMHCIIGHDNKISFTMNVRTSFGSINYVLRTLSIRTLTLINFTENIIIKAELLEIQFGTKVKLV